MNIKVLVYPKDVNPYQELLYRDMSSITIRYLTDTTSSRFLNTIFLPLTLTLLRLRGYSIIHLHWLYPFHLSSSNVILMIISEIYFRVFILITRLTNFRLVWTAHNIVPHEKTFLNDSKISLYLARSADRVIFLNAYIANNFLEFHPELKHKISVIPQGNYIDYYDYENTQSSQSKLIFGFFGQIKPYKGLHILIPIIRSIKNKDIRLNIIGKCNDKKYLNEILNLARSDKRVTIEDRYININELGTQVSKSGIIILPFTSITNSSSAMLAFSAGRPVISPKIGGMLDYPSDTGIYYNEGQLKSAIIEAIQRRSEWDLLGKNALEYAKNNDWKSISEKTAKIYRELIDL